MKRADIINKVRVLLNDKQPFEERLVVQDVNLPNKPVEQYVDAVLNDCMREVMLAAPTRLIQSKEHALTTNTIEQRSRGIKKYGVLQLPSDYLRLSAVKMQGWNKVVVIAEIQESPAYNLQLHESTMAGFIKPRVFEVCEGTATPNKIELYPIGELKLNSNDVLEDSYLKYIPYPTTLKDDVDSSSLFSEELIEPICYSCATKVLIAFGKDANATNTMYQQTLGILK